MASASFAPKYARAFQQVSASQRLDRAQVLQQLNDFAGTLSNSRELHELLANPAITHDQKLKVVDAVFAKSGFSGGAVRNFIAVLVQNGRIDALHEIVTEYAALADEASNIHEAEITSARPLNDADKQVLAAEAAKLAGTQVRVHWKEDASLLGGAVVRIGSTVYDGSVRAQLGQIERHLAGVQ